MELQFYKEEEAETLNSKKMPTLGWTKVAFAVSLLLRCRIFRVVHAPLLDEQLQVRYYPGQMFRSCSYYALIPPGETDAKSIPSVEKKKSLKWFGWLGGLPTTIPSYRS